ncbi:MAG: tetratricopeptide repeat protein, partial [Magnetococcales bacterium]|nr:tetratricopeptide repeat protein [Magnetococcales bacterium]
MSTHPPYSHDESRLIALFGKGRYADVAREARVLLAGRPEHGFAWKALGLALQQTGRPEEALTALRKAAEHLPGDVETRNGLGFVLWKQGRIEDALALFHQALALRPDEPGVLLNMGMLLQEQGREAQAETVYRELLRIRPDLVVAQFQLGVLLAGQRRPEEARNAYLEVIRLDPGQAEAWYNLAVTLEALRTPGEAEAAYREALRLRPEHVEARNNLGILMDKQGMAQEAETLFREVLAIRPECALAWYNLANLLHAGGRHVEAEAAFREAMRHDPTDARFINNLGNLLNERERYQEAEAAYRETLRVDPGFAEGHYNLGHLLQKQRRPAEAEAAYRAALRLRPDYAEASWNLGLARMQAGDWAEGWPLYEFRHHPERKEHVPAPVNLPFPRWRGEDLRGRSLLVIDEQGFGDAIQFCRFLILVKAAGAGRITLLCKPPLEPLLATLAGPDVVTANGYGLPLHDYWTLLLSIPLHLGTRPETIPAALPYLRALPERLAHWRARLPEGSPRVGLAWRGSSGNRNDAQRSLPGLATLAPLWRVPGIVFISLQKGEGEEEGQHPPEGQPLRHLGGEIRDFADSAAIVAQLDLVIAVDTALVHLCGALGRPCWVLLPAMETDWRWMLERADSPWYPGVMRLFRQSRPGAWGEVVEALAGELAPFFPALAVAQGNFGNRLLAEGRLAEAEAAYREVIRLDPGCAVAFYNLGNVLQATGRCEEAEAGYREALRLQPAYTLAGNNLGVLLQQRERFAEAETRYRKTIRHNPDWAPTHYNLANLLHEQKRFQEAENAFLEALRLRPDYHEAHNNLGNLLYEQHRLDEAEARYREAIRLWPEYADAHANLGNVHQDRREFHQAGECYRQACRLRPDQPGACANLLHMMLNACDWRQVPEYVARLLERIRAGARQVLPFSLLTLPIPPLEARACAEAVMAGIRARAGGEMRHDWRFDPQPEKIRVGYLSGDFRDHPVAHLLAGVFCQFDRSRFEILAYSHGQDDGHPVRERIRAACDRFVELDGLTDAAAARRIVEDGVHILVELQGFTRNGRPGIIARRPAPVQVNWLGYPGTLGEARVADYLIGDPIATPPEHADHFAERLALLPHCYLPHERGPAIPPPPSRPEAGLPPEGVVFCSFNQSCKINEKSFSIWCRLLEAVPGSLLWLREAPAEAVANLRREAMERGIDPDRLCFAPRTATLEAHLSRLQLADLALDTFPYNSHATGCDALWSGVPMVTLQGEAFAGRVGASLLHAVGLPERIAPDPEGYLALAVELARHPERLRALRERLRVNRLSWPLFDTARFAKDLERLYQRIWQNHQAGKVEP